VPVDGRDLVRDLGVRHDFAVFWTVNKVKSMRVAPESEEQGPDVPEFGMPGLSGRRRCDNFVLIR